MAKKKSRKKEEKQEKKRIKDEKMHIIRKKPNKKG